jgi:Sugar-transfer associated ATP-grasp
LTFPQVSRLGLRQKWRSLSDLLAGIRDVHRAERVGVIRLLREYLRIRRAIRAAPREYFRYRLWDTAAPLADRLSFITWADRRPLEAFLNPKADAVRVQSKIQSDELFRQHGLPTPARLGVWCPDGTHSDAADAIRTRDQLMSVLNRASAGVVFKRDFGGSGEFVLVFTAADMNGLHHASGEHWPIDRLLESTSAVQPWLVQSRVTAHPELAALAGCDYAATLRLVTCRWPSGRVFLLPATLKLPSTASGRDNFGAGNVAIAVNDDGVLGRGALGLDGPPINRHPATGALFEGVTVPQWAAAVEVVHRGHALLPTLRSLGWDVAITPDGPVIIEANAWWGVDVIQQPGLRGLVRGEFIDFIEELGAAHIIRRERREKSPSSVPTG